MKNMAIVFAGLLVAGSASAKSLDEHFGAQTQTEISPITVSGRSIRTNNSEAKADAALVCGSIGYLRLVQVETEPCVQDETMSVFSVPVGGTAVFVSDAGSCGRDGTTTRLKSVTCAR